MTDDVWIGAILSVPIGVGTSLAMPVIQRKLDERGNRKVLAESNRVRTEYEEVLFYHQNPVLFTQYLAQVAIRTTFISAAVAIFAQLISALGSGLYLVSREIPVAQIEQPTLALSILSQLVFMISSILIVSITRPALGIWRRVRQFEKYANTVPKDIRDAVDKQKHQR